MKKYLAAISQIFKITFTILIFLTLPLVLFTLLSSRVEVFGVKSYVVVSGSMTPSLPVGTLVFIQKANSFKPGDIITFNDGDRTITHRVLGVSTKNSLTYFQTKGDANKSADAKLVSEKDVVGKLTFFVFNVGNLTRTLKTIPGFLVLIVLPVLVLVGFEIKNIKRELEKEFRKKLLTELGVKF